MQNSYNINFDASDNLFSDAQAEKILNLKCYDCKDPFKKPHKAVKWSQIRRRLELCMKEKILRFEMNLHILIFYHI
jgi:hypothetical protein